MSYEYHTALDGYIRKRQKNGNLADRFKPASRIERVKHKTQVKSNLSQHKLPCKDEESATSFSHLPRRVVWNRSYLIFMSNVGVRVFIVCFKILGTTLHRWKLLIFYNARPCSPTGCSSL